MPSSSLFLRSSTTLVSVASLLTSVVAVPAIVPRQATAPSYVLDKSYAGSTFFDDFTFFDSADPTHGFVTYGSKQYAQSNGLIGFEGDYAVMSIDSTTNLGRGNNFWQNNQGLYWDTNNVGRKSVRIEGNHDFTTGLIITDIGELPSMCGTWPAFWTLGSGEWPKNGEIDIIEGANTQGGFWSALHTEGKSSISNVDAMSGVLTATDCQTRAGQPDANYVGCKIEDRDSTTWDNYNGGVWASQWTSERIRIWFWPYGSVPADVTSGSPKPGSAGWGTPRASYAPPETVNVNANFKNHHIIFDTTFCGDLGDATWASSGCQSRTGFASCADYVANKPRDFANAKWKVKYVKIFKEGTAPSSTSSSSIASSTSSIHSSTSSKVALSSSSKVSSSSTSKLPSASSSVVSHTSSAVISSSTSAASSSSSPVVISSTSSAAPSSVSTYSSTAPTSSKFDHSVSSVAPSSQPDAIPTSKSVSSAPYGNWTRPALSQPFTKTSSHGNDGGYGDGEGDGSWPKPTSSKPYGGGYGGDSSKPATTSSKPWDGGYGAHPIPTSSKPYGGDDEECVTSTITTTTKVPCATPPYWEVTTTIYVTSTTIYHHGPPPKIGHVEDGDDELAVPSKTPGGGYTPRPKPTDEVVPKPHVEQPAGPNKGSYSSPAAPVAPVKPTTPAAPGKPATPGGGYEAAPVASSKPYAAADSWNLANANPTGGKLFASHTYTAKPSQFTGGASQNMVFSSSFAAIIAVFAAMLM